MTHEADSRAETQGVFARFFHSAAFGSVVLLAAAVAALVWANSPWAETYFHIAHVRIGVSLGDAVYALSLQHWINDFLMAIFFFVVGLEIKRELVVGQLSSVRKATLPVLAALGGMLAPAALYAAVNAGGPGLRGWGIPMATDIAFAIGILAAFGSRAPVGLKVFLTALAIADDLGGVLVIAVFYTEQVQLDRLIVAGVFLLLIVAASRLGIRRVGIYALLVLGVWVDVLASGVHATVAGILVAMLIPVRARRDPESFFSTLRARYEELRERPLTRESMVGDRSQLDALEELHRATDEMRPPGLVLEEYLHPTVAYFILPLFAFFNAGVRIDTGVVDTLRQPVGLGIVVGLVLGKQIGIMLFSWMAVKSGRAALPEGVTWSHLYGGACLAGLGFTMSLFISELAFSEASLASQAKVGILAASVVAALWGAVVLHRCLPRGD